MTALRSGLDRGDAAVVYSDIGAARRAAGTVDDTAAADDEVVHGCG